MTATIDPNDLELAVTALTMVPEKMVCDANVASEFRGGVVVCKVNTGLVVNEDFDGPVNELSGNTLDDMDDPEENLDDVGE